MSQLRPQEVCSTVEEPSVFWKYSWTGSSLCKSHCRATKGG